MRASWLLYARARAAQPNEEKLKQEISDMRKILLTLLGAILWLVTIPSQANIIIGILPSTTSVTVGDQANIALTISGLGVNQSPSLGSFDLNFNFDPNLFSLVGASVFGDPVLGDQLDLFGLGADTAATPGAGYVNLFELSFDSENDLNNLQADSFTLATLNLRATAAGASSLTITDLILADAAGDPLTATIQNSSVTSNPSSSIPLPSSLLLLVIGLLNLVWYRPLEPNVI
jgi:hypothetical protein